MCIYICMSIYVCSYSFSCIIVNNNRDLVSESG